jgi:hypothetical protein
MGGAEIEGLSVLGIPWSLWMCPALGTLTQAHRMIPL